MCFEVTINHYPDMMPRTLAVIWRQTTSNAYNEMVGFEVIKCENCIFEMSHYNNRFR